MTEKNDKMEVDEPQLADEPEQTAEVKEGGKESRKVQTVTHVEMTGLTLLSPRQRSPDSACSNGGPAAPTLALPLPALRPEEPAASLRAALSDIVGFAHVTRYRLVVEGIDEETRGGFVSNDVPANGARRANGSAGRQSNGTVAASAGNGQKSNGAHHPGGKNGQSKKGRKKKSNGGHSSRDDNLGVVSPYTGRNARIEPALARDADGPDHVLTGRDADGNKLVDKVRGGEINGTAMTNGADKGDKTNLLSLDEYSDLSSLEALLRSDPGSAVVTRDLSEHEDQPAVRQLQDTVDGSSYGIRMVLERYDVGAVRDHLHRVRTLLGGGAPHLRAVLSEEEVAEAQAAAQAKGDDKGEGGEEQKDEVTAAPQAPPPPKSEEEAKKEKEVEEAKKKLDEAKRRSEISAQLPAFPAGYDLSHSKVREGDLREYYNLICGEEGLSAPKPKNGAGSGASNPTPGEIEGALAEINSTLDINATLTLSEYNPPPSHRRAAGDLAYVKAVMPDGLCLHVTATPLGFYVSRSTGEKYDPRPLVGKGDNSCCFSHR